MLFNSIEFLIFLPLVFFGYWFVFKSLRWQNLFVVAVSYLFYGWWDWRFLLLILFTSLCSYLSGVYLEKCYKLVFCPKVDKRQYFTEPSDLGVYFIL